MFPSGRPGAGLLLLRLAVGVTAASLGAQFLARAPDPSLVEWALAGSAIVSGISLVVGLLTPAAGAVLVLEGLGIALSRFPAVLPIAHCGPLAPWLFVAIASACLLLGPGAYSVDARLFGRREIVISSS